MSDARRPSRIRAALVLAVSGVACAHGKPAPDPVAVGSSSARQAEILAREFLTRVAQGDMTAAGEHFDGAMKRALPPDKLATVWADIVAKHGAFQGIDRVKVEPLASGLAALALTRFSKDTEALEVSISAEGRIRGFFTNGAAVVGRRFVEHLAHQEFALATEPFDEAMRAAASPAKLATLWASLQSTFGDFETIEQVTVKPNQGRFAAMVLTKFARETKALKVVVDHRAQILGFFGPPVTPAAVSEWAAPR